MKKEFTYNRAKKKKKKRENNNNIIKIGGDFCKGRVSSNTIFNNCIGQFDCLST